MLGGLGGLLGRCRIRSGSQSRRVMAVAGEMPLAIRRAGFRFESTGTSLSISGLPSRNFAQTSTGGSRMEHERMKLIVGVPCFPK